jgi:hypothetical protein
MTGKSKKYQPFYMLRQWLYSDETEIYEPHGADPPPPPATRRKTEKERQLADCKRGKGVGKEPNHTTARHPGPL